MIRRPCSCGELPAIVEREKRGIYTLRVECKCGLFGGTLMFTKPEQREKMNQAAADGWNLGG